MGSEDLFKKQKKKKQRKRTQQRKEYKKSMLIVCEGTKTEPNYFKSFPTAGVKIEIVGTGRNTLSLVEFAEKTWKGFAQKGEIYEQLWCVMDRDSFDQDDYDNSFPKIKAMGKRINKKYKKSFETPFSTKIAYSNEAFELWYLLHYIPVNTHLSRDEFKSKLSEEMGQPYKKNSTTIYHLLEILADTSEGRKGFEFAKNNAERLRAGDHTKGVHNKNPSTSVDLLVVELKKHCK